MPWPENGAECGPVFFATIENNFDTDDEIERFSCEICCKALVEQCGEDDPPGLPGAVGMNGYNACTCSAECNTESDPPNAPPCAGESWCKAGCQGCDKYGFDCSCSSLGGPRGRGLRDGSLDTYQCVTNITEQECIDALGQWNQLGECTGECDGLGDCTNAGDELCINPCCGPIACCKDGSCIGDTEGNYDPEYPEKRLPPLTKITCEYVYGGIAVPGVCGEVDCCNATIYVGACCIGESCDILTAKGCRDSNGIFMGPNSNCETVDCCIAGGACCFVDTNGQSSCQNVADEQACIDMGGTFMGGGTDCESVTCAGVGACCLPGGVCDEDHNEAWCDALGGIYHGDGSCCAG